MKKNYRFVSAAAAALLTVAPVVAGAVSPVFADTTSTANASTGAISVTGTNGSVANANEAQANDIVFTSTIDASGLTDGADASTVKATITSTVGTPKVDNGPTYIFKINANGQTVGKDGAVIGYGQYTKDNAVKNLSSGESYVAVTPNVTVSGLTAGKKYNLFGKSNIVASEYGNITSKEMGEAHNIISDPFTVPDKKFGTPMFYSIDDANQKVLSTYNYKLTSTNLNVDTIANELASKIGTKVDATGSSANDSAKVVTIWDAKHIKPILVNALKSANVTVKGSAFDMPAGDVSVKFTVTASNNKTNTMTVVLKSNAGDKSFYPIISQNGATDASVSGTSIVPADGTKQVTADSANKVFELTKANKNKLGVGHIPVNGNVDESAIKGAFTASVSNISSNAIDLKVDSSKVNTKVAGLYPVTLTATNPNGYTITASYNIVVGDPDASYKTVQSDSDITVYTIDGNNVAKTDTTIANGTQVATYGSTTVNGTKYVRINSADSNQYIESQYVDGTFKPAKQSTVTVMHNAYIYDKDHKRIGTKKISSYTNTTVYGDKTKLNDGTEAYQVGDGQYIDAGNVDGYKVTLNHNSYIYKTSKKRANHKKLLKGSTVTVYGSSFTFKNGQKYYRIAKGQYIKVVNADIVK
ncbi:SLAP domain-containing protein [Lactobacillus sp. ESL0679]|uniref:SLAP domain-containing protein n=1 Tax=Lactobacillus sp. ESL0679 TaxID=2983209 RepID=UPI0023F90AA7|nr:SLAP domain-containing protein [Lactobacillus sp. ESL0679]MDF7682290.1 SLAP domain-containing protein [Lactobacillus sp. ESL0679]